MEVKEFSFSPDDLKESSPTWTEFKETRTPSQLDQHICSEWEKKMEAGCFRYNLETCKTRVLKGRYTHVLLLNVMRKQDRRKPENVESLSKPYDHKTFNFTKVRQEEKICFLHPTWNLLESEERDTYVNQNLILINVSPLGYAHCLLVTDINEAIPQRLTLNAVRLGITTLLLSNNPGLRIGFNSLCALASVNHQHLHLWYVEEQLSIESAPVIEICKDVYEMVSMPSRAFVFQLHGTLLGTLSTNVYKVANYLQANEIAHNLLITRGVQFGEDCNSRSKTVRVYLWPRVSVTGVKDETEVIFNVAVAELAGHILMYSAERYDDIVEEDIINRISEYTLSNKQFDKIKEDIKKLLI